ncbi:3-methylcrotonyl-CoA carboxylase alpha subunit/acetyl-CoA/propionyl-CoA carboxylase, biotin carboxylase, biotin carboxyl carrier protein [Nocardioides alpinus]|uniref:ATP-grasp domain-containing protein n=2 Tax=Nocardioides TaxID=1839 RepID=A0A4Q2SKC0_9ACTN|nr:MULTISPECIES: biotin carboxylase N-terminal domain-containing protein [Nocardioides]PKH38484.1 carbamoyl-phosphate synthase subunit L [Nocardioides alpinus]RYC05371.1 ATP-grasp domain-containing protein [Nocardioides zhouii]SFB47863.1 3-methylcrotonyl-CoA carboxylase alpha subunit/acetyl-CoA/propionyl-CoA carboxylase, biotin carboxylase, biotin carboxyl carrier protein [Nocardioides alpinus]
MTTIKTLLVANRGEIALRVFRTASRLGIRTVAVFTDLDAAAPHVRAADDAIRVDSYLDVAAVVAAARAVGADAVHPGYGFLSERATFAAALEDAGVRLVGPSSTIMEQMGRKDAAREIALAAGVPVVPRGEDAGFPVLVKAAAGGGGKGMRVVRDEADLPEATAAAKREAKAAFGDDTMLIEKYVEHGRHIEVQVMGDAQGNVLHFFERDCSTQRRHQKVLEEAPAPTLDESTRQQVRQAAVNLAAHVGYTNAGTVEFLLDNATGEFYFLEMNTRLQVEHPVTEAITGLDLVELQLRIASGEPLGLTQDDIHLDGHAIEARVYAEDSFGGFLPQAGAASIVRWPTGRPGIRVDHALESNQVVSTSFDPMLGKVIAHGPDRESARLALVGALDATSILGLTTNAGFLRALVDSVEFRDATIDTAWLDTAEVPEPSNQLPRALVAWASATKIAVGGPHPFQPDGFRLAAYPAPILVELDQPIMVDVGAGTVDGRAVQTLSLHSHGHDLDLLVDGRRVRVVVDVRAGLLEIAWQGHRHVFVAPDRLAGSVPVGDGIINAPMPGTVLDVRVVHGEHVDTGAVLGVMEAMKMELSLRAPFAGTISSVDAMVGAQVPLGAALFVVLEEE